jgi:acetoacetyl-CoA synthetase
VVVDRKVLWEPPEELVANAALTRYAAWLAERRHLSFGAYQDLWRWSTEEIEAFWTSIWEFFGVPGRPPVDALSTHSMPGARWFNGASLNYARLALDDRSSPEDPAIEFHREDGHAQTISRGELGRQVGAAAEGLRRLGVGPGDRVAAYLPTIPEAVIAFLAAASVGAVWSSCSPDFGARAAVDRFGQIEPTVLVATTGYRYGGRWFDRREALAEMADALPMATVVVVDDAAGRGSLASRRQIVRWEELLSTPADPRFEPVAFEHPLWVLFSSGTTGLPKPMVQGHGGIVLEHLKSLALHLDLGPGDRFLWFTTTGWMMWNFLIGGLLVGATVVLYDGSPAHPDLGVLWRLVERARLTYLGVSAPFIHASMKAGIEPRAIADMSSLQAIGSTGAPLTPEGFEWVPAHVGPEVWLGSSAQLPRLSARPFQLLGVRVAALLL